MLSGQICEKAFVYDNDAVQEAAAVLEQTVFRKKQMWSYWISWCALPLLILILDFITGEYTNLYVFALFFVCPFLERSSFREQYCQANTWVEGDEMYAAERTMTVTDDGVTILARNLEEHPTDAGYGDIWEKQEVCQQFLFQKMHIYESGNIILLYCNNHHNQAIPKKYFQKSEIHALQTLFEEKLEKKYIRIC